MRESAFLSRLVTLVELMVVVGAEGGGWGLAGWLAPEIAFLSVGAVGDEVRVGWSVGVGVGAVAETGLDDEDEGVTDPSGCRRRLARTGIDFDMRLAVCRWAAVRPKAALAKVGGEAVSEEACMIIGRGP